jgi:hypothetical protein
MVCVSKYAVVAFSVLEPILIFVIVFFCFVLSVLYSHATVSYEVLRRRTYLPFNNQLWWLFLYFVPLIFSSFPLYTPLHQESRESGNAIPSPAGYGKLKS